VAEFVARHKGDRTGMELLDFGFREQLRENFAKWCLPHVRKIDEVSEVNTRDIITAIAQYGGRIEVAGLGAFFVRDLQQRPITDADGNITRIRSARRHVEFMMSKTLRDMVNEDYAYQTEPLPNSDFFIERRSIRI
jgi:nucleoid DNA-binding protein